MTLGEQINLLESLSIIGASCVAMYGIDSWRRETKWKRKFDLAEEAMSCFYDAEERLAIIRSPASYSHEGKTRKKEENETPKEAAIMDLAYVTFERYEREKEPFVKLRALRHRFAAVFREEFSVPFDEVRKIVREVLSASNTYYRHQLRSEDRTHGMSEKELERHLEKMQTLEDIFWSSESDIISERMREAIEKIEHICEKVLHHEKVFADKMKNLSIFIIILFIGLILPILIFFYHGWGALPLKIVASYLLFSFIGIILMVFWVNRFTKSIDKT